MRGAVVWLDKIPLYKSVVTDRVGVGHVFCNCHVSDDG